VEGLRLEGVERAADLESRLAGFQALVEVKPGGAPRLVTSTDESLGPGTLVLGLTAQALPRVPEPPAPPPARRRFAGVEVGLALAAALLAVVPSSPLLRAPLEASERPRPLAASAWRPLAAALQDKEASRFGESPLPWRAVALSAHALLAAAGYAFARR